MFDDNIARNAGDWFSLNNIIYRPAQDCNITYGGAVIIQKVEKTSEGRLKFTNGRRIESDNAEYNQGCHTFNHYNGVSVIDAKGWRSPFAHSVYEFLYNIKKSISK